VKNELVGKLYITLSNAEQLSEAEVRSMMVIFRKLLDGMQGQQQQNFLITRLFANWAVHNEISNSNTGLRILSSINNALVRFKNADTDAFIEGISSEFGLLALSNELQLLLAASGIDPNLISKKEVWGRFTEHLVEIIRDVPITFPDLATLDAKKQKIYDEISQNSIKPGAGVVAISLSIVDYDALGAKDVGKVLCIIITAADTTKIVVPFKRPQRGMAAVA
jgi:hypothetical protein